MTAFSILQPACVCESFWGCVQRRTGVLQDPCGTIIDANIQKKSYLSYNPLSPYTFLAHGFEFYVCETIVRQSSTPPTLEDKVSLDTIRLASRMYLSDLHKNEAGQQRTEQLSQSVCSYAWNPTQWFYNIWDLCEICVAVTTTPGLRPIGEDLLLPDVPPKMSFAFFFLF